MGAITSLWQFIIGKPSDKVMPDYFSGKPSEVAKSGKGDAGAVKSPTIDNTPRYCGATLKLVSRPRGATMSHLISKTGKTKGSLSQEISILRKHGHNILKSRKDSKSEYTYKVM